MGTGVDSAQEARASERQHRRARGATPAQEVADAETGEHAQPERHQHGEAGRHPQPVEPGDVVVEELVEPGRVQLPSPGLRPRAQ